MEENIILNYNIKFINKIKKKLKSKIIYSKKGKNNFKKIISYTSKLIFNIISLICLYFGITFYIKSLKGCGEDEFTCININIRFIYEDINDSIKYNIIV